MIVRLFGLRVPIPEVKSPWIFYGVGCLILAYLVMISVRKRKGPPPGSDDRDSIL